MMMAIHDCCEKKHCKCRGFLKFVFGAGVLGLLAHMVYGYLEEDKPCPLKGWLAKHGNESTAEIEEFDDRHKLFTRGGSKKYTPEYTPITQREKKNIQQKKEGRIWRSH